MSNGNYGDMFYSAKQPAWHAIEKPAPRPMSAVEILKERFHGGFPVFLRPAHVELNGEMVEHDYAIVRGKSSYDQKEEVFEFCTERYQPLQPADVAESFDAHVCEPVESMAFLGKGEEMYISWKMPSCEVRVGDVVDMFGVVRVGFNTLKGARLFTTIYRLFCSNTLSTAQGWAKRNTDGKGRGEIWKGKAVNHNLLRDLGYWMEHVQGTALQEVNTLCSLFGLFAKTPIKNDAEAKELLAEAYPTSADVSGYFPVQLRTKKEEDTLAFNQSQLDLQNGIFELFAGAGTAITPDYWGMLNATSEWYCHVLPSKKPIAESLMFGGRQKQINKMLTVLSGRTR